MFAVSSVNLFTAICVPIVFSVSVHIDGIIDLGPNWNYEYKLESVQAIPFTAKMEQARPTTQKAKKKVSIKNIRNEAPELRVTQYTDNFKPKSLYDDPHTVKEDSKINDFTYHVYKQSLKVFDNIKQKINPDIAFRVDMLSRSYDEKFREFINETAIQKIKTRLGSQKVIFNTIDTSNRLLRRLVNYFIGDLNRDGLLRNNEVSVNVFQKEVDRECNLELMHVCNKFGICRTSKGFSEFLHDFFTIIIKNDNRKVKIASDALTEVAKNTDFSNVMEPKTRVKFLRTIDMIEKWDGMKAKAMFWIMKNMLAMKNQPIKVMTGGGKHIQKTVAVFEVIDELEKKLPANEDNMLEWTDLKTSLSDWSDGKRADILEIMQGLVSHFKKKAMDKMNSDTSRNLNDKFDIIFS